ncbi:MAG: hypothetical protein ACOC9P_00150 [bacterium]
MSAIDVAAHPTRPLIYLWQDIVVTEDASPPERARDAVDHLIVFDLSGAEPKRVLEAARGTSYALGNDAGTLTVDQEHGRLFLPNLRCRNDADEYVPAIGYTMLDDDGLPALDTNQQPVLHTTALDRLAMPGGWPGGLSVGAEDVVTFGAYMGFATWSIDNSRQQFNSIPMRWGRMRSAMTGHSDQPMVYLVPGGMQYIYAMRHADGYLTMMPQELDMGAGTGGARPLVVPPRNIVVIGTFQRVALIRLDEHGRFTGEVDDLPVDVRRVTVYAYSRKLDRLYIMVKEAS